MYQEILVPTDGSARATMAATHALSLAGEYEARVHALYVMDTAAAAGSGSAVEEVRERLVETGERAVAAIESRAADMDVPVVTSLVEGAPADVIIEYARENDVDIIVMGTHGRSGLPRYLLGSVTERVVRRARVPVLTVSQTDEDATVTSAAGAISAARTALKDRGYGAIEFPETPYLHGNTWILRAHASGETFNVHVDSATKAVVLRTIGGNSD
jgi:nucleotide-binding universal stress UspA family protein